MAISPNSYIKVLENVPLDSAHQNTIYWQNTTAQQNYFSGLAKYTFAPATYQRRESSILVPQSADSLYSCNYVMFQNTAYGGRWFYGFIDAVNYINDNTAEIVYTIDPLQSWWGAWNMGMCFVEREHSHTDNVGDNILPESFALGDYVMINNTKLNAASNLKVYVAATFDKYFQGYYGDISGNAFSGLCFNEFDPSNVSEIITFIQDATKKQLSDGIVSIFMSPDMTGTLPDEPNVQEFTLTANIFGDFDGYTPKNKKMYTYPYNFMFVYTDDGLSIDYAYEFFNNSILDFKVYCSYSATPELVLVPQNYKGATENLNEKISLGGFPQCAYNIDAYKAWIAQNANGFWLQNAQNISSSIFNGVNSAISGNPLAIGSGLANAGFSIAKDMNTLDVLSHTPNAAKGSSTGGATYTNNKKDFYYCTMRIRSDFAKMIDDFWTRYGYPKRRLAQPDITARPEYTYTKTIGAYIYGDAPASDLQKIASYFDNGITFWQNPANVGNYLVNNSV